MMILKENVRNIKEKRVSMVSLKYIKGKLFLKVKLKTQYLEAEIPFR